MRVVAVGSSVAALAAVLQGCGGGGNADYQSCLNSQPRLKTQSATGKITGHEDSTDPEAAGSFDFDASIVSKWDFEKFNVFFDLDAKVKGTDDKHYNVKFLFIINIAKREIVVKIHIDGQQSTCFRKSLPLVVTPELVKHVFDGTVLPTMQKLATCGGNNGKLDYWKYDVTLHGPLPGTGDVTGEFTEHLEIKADKDVMIHEIAGWETAHIEKPRKFDVNANVDVKYDSIVPSGPSDSDLDWSKWGKCTPSTVNSTHDVLHFGDSKELKIMEKLLTKNFFMKKLSSMLNEVLNASVNDYQFGPCLGPDKTKGFNTEVYGKTLADGTITWWPTFRPDDISKGDHKAQDLAVTCGKTGDFGYQCSFGELSCRSGMDSIAKMCKDKVFKSCSGVPSDSEVVV